MSSPKLTKKDLEAKIAALEEKLAKLANQLESQPQAPPKPQTQAPPPPAPKPQTTAPPPAPKPQEAEIVVWEQWKNAPMSDFHSYRAKVTGYSPGPNRYFASKHVRNADVPTSDWNQQKVKVTGYTQPSNMYFATRQRLAYHPRPKNFAGYGIKGTAGTAQASAPPPAPKPTQGKLPKDASAPSSSGDSRKGQLEAYEKAYLARLQQQQEQAKVAPPPPAPKPNPNRGTMPQGWKPS